MSNTYTCRACGQFNLKQITSKKSGKLYWVCQGPEEVCNAIYGDGGGKPDFPEENPAALLLLEWLSDDDNRKGLSEWEVKFVSSLEEKANEQLDSPLTFTDKQLKSLKKISEKFANAPKV